MPALILRHCTALADVINYEGKGATFVDLIIVPVGHPFFFLVQKFEIKNHWYGMEKITMQAISGILNENRIENNMEIVNVCLFGTWDYCCFSNSQIS